MMIVKHRSPVYIGPISNHLISSVALKKRGALKYYK